MIKKIGIIMMSTFVLMACSKNQNIEDLKEALEIKTYEINYDPKEIANIRVLDIFNDDILYQKVLSKDMSSQIVLESEKGVEEVIKIEGNEVINSATKINDMYYYSTYELDESLTHAIYKVYRQEELLAQGFAELSAVPEIIRIENEAYVILKETSFINNIENKQNSIYLYNMTKEAIVTEIPKTNKEVTQTISDQRNGINKGSYQFTVIEEYDDTLMTYIYTYQNGKIDMQELPKVAISQILNTEHNIMTYSTSTHDLMSKKIAYTRDDELTKSNTEIVFLEKVKEVLDGTVVYGQIGEHDSQITYYYLTVSDDLSVEQIPLFENDYGLRLPNGFLNIDDRDYQDGKIILNFIENR